MTSTLPPALSDYLDMLPEVSGALKTGAPVVALESTIVTHGMPYPQNMEMAAGVEALIREGGAVPATIAVMDGRLKVGLDADELEKLAKTKGAMKLSRADLAFALASGRAGGTTVAATMMASQLCGIEVFATGGIGGVHRGAGDSFDISADLREFTRSSVITVCAGAKAILDMAKTLEFLETEGVPVIGFGTSDFPAFWSRTSGLKAPLRFDDAEAVARLWSVRKAIGQPGGMLIANPVPEEDEIPAGEMKRHIENALADADENSIGGKAVTPYLLSRILELTGGRSLEANIALVRNNARVAAQIAVAIASR
ncbi:MAG TPA: pseudouridine-5'-phosphate glycosidase [Rhizobiaceae bacterium]|nr:pseudouridine-5'-phosphate glycosidase [Rhizobiaceae bacterium]